MGDIFLSRMQNNVDIIFFSDGAAGVKMVPAVSERTVSAARDHLSVLCLL